MTHPHFDRLLRLLDLESKAEARRLSGNAQRLSAAAAERTGQTLVDLVVIDEDAGLGGRTLLTLAKRNRTLTLPWNRLGAGTPVVVTTESTTTSIHERGVVFRRDERTIGVAMTSVPDDLLEADTLRLTVSTDEVAIDRQRAALRAADAARGNRLADLRRVMLGERPPRSRAVKPWTPLNPTLNEAQRQAVDLALAADDVALLHGPPGTGKTTAVVELIRQAVARGQQVLACAPSNLAVDNLMERLVAQGERAVRIGHPARVTPGLREHTLDQLVDAHPDVRVARKLVKDAWALFRKAARYTRAKPEPGARRDMRQEARALLADARRLEDVAVQHVLGTASVVCATTTGLDRDVLGDRSFGLVVIDEASQSTEPGCWVPLAWAERLVLAGDHCQLPPTVVSPEAMAGGFAVSLFERLIELLGSAAARRLERQYRMHEAIMGFSSAEFYDGALVADEAVRGHRLCDLPGVACNALTDTPIEFVDTAGAGYDEELEPDGESRRNVQEAEVVMARVGALVAAGVAAEQIAVISPYAAQVRHLRERLELPALEVDSVDGFQGREKEAIVISTVRSNPRGEIGFLGELRRMNVAMTRARRKLLIVGDSATLSSDTFFARMLEYVEAHGGYRTVWDA